jgi:hypothetical protein
VLLFDFITGPIMSSYMFRLPFEVALAGQIPFTAMHLASAVALTSIIAPVVDPELRLNLQSAFSGYLQQARVAFSRPVRWQ